MTETVESKEIAVIAKIERIEIRLQKSANGHFFYYINIKSSCK